MHSHPAFDKRRLRPTGLDPVFSNFSRYSGPVPAGLDVGFLGDLTRADWWTGTPNPSALQARHVDAPYPPFDSEYFEYLPLLESVMHAQDRFIMIELGSGWGRWLIRAYHALRQTGDAPCLLVGVEAEPTHFKMMNEHFRTNGLDPGQHRLIPAAVSGHDGEVLFTTGHPDTWYGQAIVSHKDFKMPGFVRMRVEQRPSVSLDRILSSLERVDYIDLDVQGEELRILSNTSRHRLDHVRRMCINTHDRDLEKSLHDLLIDAGWACLYDFPCGCTHEAPLGTIHFEDGIQYWINPREARLDRPGGSPDPSAPAR